MSGSATRSRSRWVIGLSALVLALGSSILGGSPAGANDFTDTFNYTGPPVPIPDGLGGDVPGPRANANVQVSGTTGTIVDMVLVIGGTSCNTTAGSTTVGIDHTWVRDLVVTLVSPRGTRVDVIDRVGGDGNNFCHTILYDGATKSIDDAANTDAPFTGEYRPSHPLAAFNGEPANGTWHLQARDYVDTETGTIRAFSMNIETVTQPSVTVQSSVPQGGCFTLTGQGLAELTNYEVSMSRGKFLGYVTTDSRGRLTASVCIPSNTPVGTQVLTISNGPDDSYTRTVQVTRG